MPRKRKTPLEIVHAEENTLYTRIELAKIRLQYAEQHLKDVQKYRRKLEEAT